MRALYCELLREEGYDVATLDCREADRDALRRIDPDAVVIDCFLGGDISGWELMQVWRLDPVLQRVPVLICTTDARMTQDDARAALAAGVHVLSKPFDLQELLEALALALRAPRSRPRP
jgi:CheY-like chemotaxis protein